MCDGVFAGEAGWQDAEIACASLPDHPATVMASRSGSRTMTVCRSRSTIMVL